MLSGLRDRALPRAELNIDSDIHRGAAMPEAGKEWRVGEGGGGAGGGRMGVLALGMASRCFQKKWRLSYHHAGAGTRLSRLGD